MQTISDNPWYFYNFDANDNTWLYPAIVPSSYPYLAYGTAPALLYNNGATLTAGRGRPLTAYNVQNQYRGGGIYLPGTTLIALPEAQINLFPILTLSVEFSFFYSGYPSRSTEYNLFCIGTPNSNNSTIGVSLQTNGTLKLFHWGADVTSTVSAVHNTFNHVIVTYTSGVGSKLYLNGQLIVTNTNATSLTSGGVMFGGFATGTYLGGFTTAVTLPYTGTLDDIALYPSAFTQAQVTAHYLAACPWYRKQITTNAPLRYYPLHHKIAVAPDLGSQQQHINAFAGSVGVAGSPIYCDESFGLSFVNKTSYVTAPGTNLPAGNSPWTAECWFQFTANAVLANLNEFLLGWGGGSTKSAVFLGRGDGSFNLKCDVYNYSVYAPFGATTNLPYHLVATYDSTTINLYVNGKLQGTGVPGTLSIPAGDASTNLLYIGAGARGIYPCANAVIGHVAVYGSALSATTIKQNYWTGLGLLAWQRFTDGMSLLWRFLETSGTTAYEYSGSGGPSGTLTGSATQGVNGLGQMERAFAWDLTGGYVSLTTGTTATSWTLEGWFRASHVVETLPATIVSVVTSSSTVSLQVTTSGTYAVTSSTGTVAASTTIAEDMTWHSVQISGTGTTVQILVDNQLIGTATISSATLSGSAEICLGAVAGTHTQSWQGLIDEWGFYPTTGVPDHTIYPIFYTFTYVNLTAPNRFYQFGDPSPSAVLNLAYPQAAAPSTLAGSGITAISSIAPLQTSLQTTQIGQYFGQYWVNGAWRPTSGQILTSGANDCASGSQYFSAAALVYLTATPTSSGGYPYIITQSSNAISTGLGWYIGFQNSTGKVAAGIFGTDCVAPSALSLNQLHHLCVTFDGEYIILYIDGSGVATQFVEGNTYSIGNAQLTLGGATGTNAFAFQGGIVLDVKQWNYALTNAMISDLAKSVYAQNGAPYYPMEYQIMFTGAMRFADCWDASCVLDSFLPTNDATASGSVLGGVALGSQVTARNAGYVPGASGASITYPAYPQQSTFSLFFWVVPMATPTGNILYNSVISQAQGGFAFSWTSTTFSLTTATTSGVSPTTISGTVTWEVGAWTWLGMTYDGTTLSLWKDNVLVASATTSTPKASTGSVVFGPAITCYLDDVILWPVALSARIRSWLYTSALTGGTISPGIVGARTGNAQLYGARAFTFYNTFGANATPGFVYPRLSLVGTLSAPNQSVRTYLTLGVKIAQVVTTTLTLTTAITGTVTLTLPMTTTIGPAVQAWTINGTVVPGPEQLTFSSPTVQTDLQGRIVYQGSRSMTWSWQTLLDSELAALLAVYTSASTHVTLTWLDETTNTWQITQAVMQPPDRGKRTTVIHNTVSVTFTELIP